MTYIASFPNFINPFPHHVSAGISMERATELRTLCNIHLYRASITEKFPLFEYSKNPLSPQTALWKDEKKKEKKKKINPE